MKMDIKERLKKLKPGVPRRVLLFVAGLVWTFAGGMLLFRGISALIEKTDFPLLRFFVSLAAGVLFYVLVFDKISLKHSRRILLLPEERPCLFAFFNFRSYLIMALMISMGIALRMSNIIPQDYLQLFYITMGTPLLLSAIRFFGYGIRYQELNKT